MAKRKRKRKNPELGWEELYELVSLEAKAVHDDDEGTHILHEDGTITALRVEDARPTMLVPGQVTFEIRPRAGVKAYHGGMDPMSLPGGRRSNTSTYLCASLEDCIRIRELFEEFLQLRRPLHESEVQDNEQAA